FVDHHSGPAQLEAEGNLHHFRGLEGVLDQNLRRLVPADDVDLFAAQFIDDVLDAAATHTDAGTHRIDLGVDGADRDLGAVTGLAGHGFDFDDALGDFGHFHLEQSANEKLIAAAEHDLD